MRSHHCWKWGPEPQSIISEFDDRCGAVRGHRPANLYAFCVTDTHFDLKVNWNDLSLWTTQNSGYASVHTQFSNQATEKEEFDQSERFFSGFAFKSFLCVLFLSKQAVCLWVYALLPFIMCIWKSSTRETSYLMISVSKPAVPTKENIRAY